MDAKYQARWISKSQVAALRKTGAMREGVLVHHLKGLLIVEPVGRKLGDGKVLGRTLADYELRPVWCLDPMPQLGEARRRLGLAVHGGAVAPATGPGTPRGHGFRAI
jgi:hypothetical protein